MMTTDPIGRPPSVREELLGLTYEDLKDESFYRKICKGRVSWGIVCDLYENFMDSYSDDQLAEIIHGFTGSWPHTRNHLILVSGAGSCIENLHFEFLHNKPHTKKFNDSHREFIIRLNLHNKKRGNGSEKKDNKEKKKKNPRDIGDEIAQKLREMSIEEMLAWEKKLGADDATIKKHKSIDQAGRQRMSVGNAIRFRMRKKKEAGEDTSKYWPE